MGQLTDIKRFYAWGVKGKVFGNVNAKRDCLRRVEKIMKMTLFVIYQLLSAFTFIYLTFFDGYIYTWWNWMIAIPVNVFLAEIWPIYWGLFHWF